jgi:hypothetical protein
MNTLITSGYGKAIPANFNAKYVHKYFCDVVQGDVSNDVRQENSVAVNLGAWIPTGSIAFIAGTEDGKNTIATVTEKTGVPQIVIVGTEHGNVHSEFGNSGCGLITMIPLTAKNTFMTTVFEEGTYAVGDKLTVKEITFNGKTVLGVAKAADGDMIVGIVRAGVAKTHYGINGIMFDAYFQPAAASVEG